MSTTQDQDKMSLEITSQKLSKDINRLLTRRDRAYILEFRHKNRMGFTAGRVKNKVFWFDGPLKDAIERSRVHCDRMDYTFIYCFPYIVDLDAQEELHSRHELDEEEF